MTITRPRTLFLVTALGVALALPACGSSKTSTTSGKASADLPTSGTTAAGAATTVVASGFSSAASPSTTAAASGPSTGGNGATPVPVPPADRKVVMVVTLDVQVDNVATASVKVTSIVQGAGGYVANQQAALGGDRPSSTLVLKVPPEKVSFVLEGIGGLGKVANQTQQADDVTSQYFDLESRITTARASVERVRSFLAKTNNVAELASLEAELTRRETELEQLVAAQQGLAARAALATVTVALTPAPPVTTTTTSTTQPTLTPRRALHAGAGFLTDVGKGLAIVAAFLLPFLPFIAIGLMIAAALRRRTRRPVPAAPQPAPEPERESEPASR